MAAAVSLGALGYALLIATVAKTTEQATIIGGAGNIVLAAIGGVMVPKFVMPAAMQTLANFSPMSWGLDGFLNVLLRNGQLRDVLQPAAELSAFGLVTLALAAHWYTRSVE
jgi:ABC-2 type transport system permease protein